MSSCSRLEGIPFKWQGTDPQEGLDCFTYANLIRLTFLAAPLYDTIPVDVYPEVNTMPQGFLLGMAQKFGTPVSSPEPFNILVINLHNEDCLATLLPSGDLAFMTWGGSKLRSLKKFSGGSIRGMFKVPEEEDEKTRLHKKLVEFLREEFNWLDSVAIGKITNQAIEEMFPPVIIETPCRYHVLVLEPRPHSLSPVNTAVTIDRVTMSIISCPVCD